MREDNRCLWGRRTSPRWLQLQDRSLSLTPCFLQNKINEMAMEPQDQANQANKQKPKRSYKGILFLIAVIAILLIVSLVVLFVADSSQNRTSVKVIPSSSGSAGLN